MVRMLAIVLLVGLTSLACTTTTEPEPVVEPEPVTTVAETAPAPPPEPEPVTVSAREPAPVRELPKTASALPLLGLTGLGALALGGAVRLGRTLRRR